VHRATGWGKAATSSSTVSLRCWLVIKCQDRLSGNKTIVFPYEHQWTCEGAAWAGALANETMTLYLLLPFEHIYAWSKHLSKLPSLLQMSKDV
jgi:hypothetical protein